MNALRIEKRQIRILIIEDDMVDRMACRRALARNSDLDCEILEAETGGHGLELYLSNNPDCILLDYNLPDFSGLELLAELTDEMGDIPVPVMMLTGANNADIAVEAMKRGARDYLVKDTGHQYLELLPAVIERVLREQWALLEKRQTEAMYRTLVEKIPAITYIASLDDGGRFTYVSPQVKVLGFAPEEWIGDPQLHLRQVHPDDKFRVQEAISRSRNLDIPLRCEYRLLSKNGAIRWFRDEAEIVRDEAGRMLFYQGLLVDITDSKEVEDELRQHRSHLEELVYKRTSVLTKANEQLRNVIEEKNHIEDALFKEKERIQITLESIGDAVITTDAYGKVEYLNRIAEELTGWSARDAAHKPLELVCNIIDESTGLAVENLVSQCLREGRRNNVSIPRLIIRRDGSEIAITESAAPIYARSGNLIGAILVLHDVTEARSLAQQLAYQATHDALTGLVNRPEFEKRVQRVLETVHQGNSEHALCYLDLDRFKIVNDSCGHAAGDELLRQIGKLLHERMRQRDTLARLGGDEFGILLEHCPPDRAKQIATDLLDSIQDFRFNWKDKTFTIGMSIGVTEINGSTESLFSALSAADSACYIAKEKGRNRMHFYQPGDSDSVEWQTQMQWASRITRALNDDLFKLCYQSIAPLVSGESERSHYEILLRLQNEDGTLILPSEFLPVAERYNLMPAIDQWVISQAIANIANIIRDKSVLPVFEINLSAASVFNDENLPAFIGNLLKERHVPGETLCFEISEMTVLSNPRQAARFANAVKGFGCLFALDNFGKGISSFSYLKEIPIDFLKIDGRFIKSMAEDNLSRAIAQAINQVAHVMAIQTVAECAETEIILKMLKDLGVDHAQGYALANPVLLDEMTKTQSMPPSD